jgi:imidazolonepropionase-like amidohydrolase
VRAIFASLTRLTAGLLLPALVVSVAGATPPPPKTSFKLVNGRWFDGTGFKRRVVYVVGGLLAEKPAGAIDDVVDLKDGYVVPPFCDAHNHYIAGPHDIDKILREYLRDGIFYAKNPASIKRDTDKIRDLINKPDSVDVVFANAGLTATGGHPVRLYEEYLAKVKKPGPDGTFENLGYIIIDNAADLDKKWPGIMAEAPDFIKGHLLYSEEFEKRRDDPAFYGHKGLDPKVLRMIVDRAHADHLRVSCHIETAADFRNALEAGVDEINHMPGYFPTPEHPEWFPITSQDAALAARKKVFVVTTTYVATAEMNKPEQAEELARAKSIQAANLRLLRDAGVRIAVGPDVYGATSLAEAMNLRSLDVFDNRALLKAWTQTSAETIFPKRKIGRLERGYEASFLVLGGDPLADFDKVKDIRMRCKQGAFIRLD